MYFVALACFYLLVARRENEVFGKATFEDTKRLLEHIKSNYTRDLRPVRSPSEPVRVRIQMFLVGIQKFDEVLETLTTSAGLSVSWSDQGINWNPNDFGGLTELNVRHHGFLWSPPTALLNSAEELKDVFNGKEYTAMIGLKGSIRILVGDMFRSSCPVDITYYPFDQQVCDFKFIIFGYGLEEIEFVARQSTIRTGYFSAAGPWILTNTSGIITTHQATFTVYLERTSSYVILNIMIPIVAMSILNLFVFFIPVESGERFSYGLTVLLSIAVFLTLVGQTLPKTSGPMSWFSVCLVGNVLLSIAVTITVIFNMRIYHKEGNVCNWLLKWCSRKTQKAVNIKADKSDNYVLYRHNYRGNKAFEPDVGILANRHGRNNSVLPRLHVTKIGVDDNKSTQSNSDYDSDVRINSNQSISDNPTLWKDVSLSIDKAAFVVFSLLLVFIYGAYTVVIIYKL